MFFLNSGTLNHLMEGISSYSPFKTWKVSEEILRQSKHALGLGIFKAVQHALNRPTSNLSTDLNLAIEFVFIGYR